MSLTLTEWILGALAALLVGFSKTGMPGVGILVVPLMASVFGGRVSIGTLLALLIFADCFAVKWYHKDAQWDKLLKLLPYVAAGMILGTAGLWALGEAKTPKDLLNHIIGGLVLFMLVVHFARQKWGRHLTLTSPVALAPVGGLVGFSTTLSNAAGPLMAIYLTGLKLPKKQFMGTTACYFLTVNLAKVPIYAGLTFAMPGKPFITPSSLWFDLSVCPVVLIGIYLGKWLLPRITQTHFDILVLALAAIAALKLILT